LTVADLFVVVAVCIEHVGQLALTTALVLEVRVCAEGSVQIQVNLVSPLGMLALGAKFSVIATHGGMLGAIQGHLEELRPNPSSQAVWDTTEYHGSQNGGMLRDCSTALQI
jgi:hypothetical protein